MNRGAPRGGDVAAKAEYVLANTTVTETGCWEWQGRVGNGGYGRVGYCGRDVAATRIVAAALLGLDISDRATHVCHRCDNPPCVNPEHLFLGTAADNRRDAITKGRAVIPPSDKWDRCARGHDLSVTRERKAGKAGGSHCGTCRRARHAEGERRRRRQRKGAAA